MAWASYERGTEFTATVRDSAYISVTIRLGADGGRMILRQGNDEIVLSLKGADALADAISDLLTGSQP